MHRRLLLFICLDINFGEIQHLFDENREYLSFFSRLRDQVYYSCISNQKSLHSLIWSIMFYFIVLYDLMIYIPKMVMNALCFEKVCGMFIWQYLFRCICAIAFLLTFVNMNSGCSKHLRHTSSTYQNTTCTNCILYIWSMCCIYQQTKTQHVYCIATIFCLFFALCVVFINIPKHNV